MSKTLSLIAPSEVQANVVTFNSAINALHSAYSAYTAYTAYTDLVQSHLVPPSPVVRGLNRPGLCTLLDAQWVGPIRFQIRSHWFPEVAMWSVQNIGSRS